MQFINTLFIIRIGAPWPRGSPCHGIVWEPSIQLSLYWSPMGCSSSKRMALLDDLLDVLVRVCLYVCVCFNHIIMRAKGEKTCQTL